MHEQASEGKYEYNGALFLPVLKTYEVFVDKSAKHIFPLQIASNVSTHYSRKENKKRKHKEISGKEGIKPEKAEKGSKTDASTKKDEKIKTKDRC